MTAKSLTCVECGQRFQALSNAAKTCSAQCAKARKQRRDRERQAMIHTGEYRPKEENPDPSPTEIEAAAERIRAAWSEEERRCRQAGKKLTGDE